MKWLLVVMTLFMLGGCGDSSVDWFPDQDSGQGSVSPQNNFDFVKQPNVDPSTEITTPPVEITGTQDSGWTITVTDGDTGANSKYSINGGAFTNTAGTIKPNQSLRIQHTSAATAATTTTTRVKIGELEKTFQSETKP